MFVRLYQTIVFISIVFCGKGIVIKKYIINIKNNAEPFINHIIIRKNIIYFIIASISLFIGSMYFIFWLQQHSISNGDFTSELNNDIYNNDININDNDNIYNIYEINNGEIYQTSINDSNEYIDDNYISLEYDDFQDIIYDYYYDYLTEIFAESTPEPMPAPDYITAPAPDPYRHQTIITDPIPYDDTGYTIEPPIGDWGDDILYYAPEGDWDD